MIKFFSGIFLLILLFSCSSRDNNNHANGNPGQNTFTQQQPIDETDEKIDQYLSSEDFDELVQSYEDPSRVEWQNPDLVLDKLGNLEGRVVADIGAGSGYFTFRMAQTAKKVIAIDIDPRFLEYIDERKEESPGIIPERIETRQAEENDPTLDRAEADIALVVNTYHYLDNRSEYFKKVKQGLSKDGFLVIVDFKNMPMPVGPPEELKVAPEMVVKELREAGFMEFTIDEKSLQYQYIITGG